MKNKMMYALLVGDREDSHPRTQNKTEKMITTVPLCLRTQGRLSGRRVVVQALQKAETQVKLSKNKVVRALGTEKQ